MREVVDTIPTSVGEVKDLGTRFYLVLSALVEIWCGYA